MYEEGHVVTSTPWDTLAELGLQVQTMADTCRVLTELIGDFEHDA
jgi:hypothetical protein